MDETGRSPLAVTDVVALPGRTTDASDDREVDRALAVIVDLIDALRPGLAAASGAVEVDIKEDGTPVTAIDVATDERLTAGLAARFPTHAVVSEERAAIGPDATWTWVIDPIDGTSNFIAGLPSWCVSVALCLEGVPVLGVIDAPALSTRWVARAGRGAHRDGRPIRVRPGVDWHDPSLRHQPVMLTSSAAARLTTTSLHLNARLVGSVALDLAAVADGSAAASVSWVPHVWDVAAGVLLVTEAGGACVGSSGVPLLPVVAGVDYARRTSMVATGTDPVTLDGLVAAIVHAPRPH